MEFVDYQEVLPSLREQGLVEAADGEQLIRLEMEMSGPPLTVFHFRDPASRTPPFPDARITERPRGALADLVDEVLGRLHLNEVLTFPVGTWRNIIDAVAFDLATDEDWIEMDAIAAMHQNTRNALAVTRGETSVLIEMIRALLNNADSPQHDLTITSDVTPLLIEVFHDGAVSVSVEARLAPQIERMMA